LAARHYTCEPTSAGVMACLAPSVRRRNALLLGGFTGHK